MASKGFRILIGKHPGAAPRLTADITVNTRQSERVLKAAVDIGIPVV
jgi:hypothetical protein